MSSRTPRTIAEIIEAYNNEGLSAEEYNTENEDCSLAEFCQSFGYHESNINQVIRDADLADETKALLTAHVSKHGSRETFNLLAKHCELKCVGIYTQTNEVYSVQIGEIEHQPDDKLIEAYLKLSPKSQEKVRKACDWHISDSSCKGWLYIGCDYERWVMVCDEDSLLGDLPTKGHLTSYDGTGCITRRSRAKLSLVS
jgi:hypothetical protein